MSKKGEIIYTADFETNVSDENIECGYTDVWLWDICNIKTLKHQTGNTLDEFMEMVHKLPNNAKIYFHNLKFDGTFILHWLLKNGFTHNESKPKSNEFSTIITDLGVFYSIKVCFSQKHSVEFRDSLKKISGSVEEIAKAYELPILKGKIDYKVKRINPYVATADEIAYIHNDTEIIARVLALEYDAGMNELTTASDTFADYKVCVGLPFKILYPVLSIEEDDFIRTSYRGGVCQVADRYKGKELTNVYVYDVNSMYPHKMIEQYPLPYGRPQVFVGKYKINPVYPLYIQRIKVCCELKPKHQPTILMKEHAVQFDKDYLISTDGYMVELTLTNIDLDLLFEHYNIYDIEYIGGLMFMASTNLFHKYLKPIYEKKCTTKGAEKQLNKLKLNALYGKFATNPRHYNKIPFLVDDVVKYKVSDLTIKEPIYTAVSSFITAHARKQLFDTIQAHYDNFVYCDTDSVHLLCEMKSGFDVDDKRLGAWKLEKIYTKAKYLAQKTYFGVKDNGVDIKIAGAPKNIKEILTYDTFKIGFTAKGKLIPKNVKGGVILTETDFTIKERKKKIKKEA